MSIANKTNSAWFPQALTLLFIALKLTGHIAWSWVWVLSPMWALWVAALCVGIVAGVIAVNKAGAVKR